MISDLKNKQPSWKDKLMALRDAQETVSFTGWESMFLNTVTGQGYINNPDRLSDKQKAIIDRLMGIYQLWGECK